ncbi:MAG TPA: NUDIX domain-containing protein [Roseiflexaceae bacterium]|nr:NUDIX domain-containing protein [Roseiflexaceae bacterium]
MQRTIRYQGAVIRGDHILLIQHHHHADGHSYWLLLGGGLEGDETPETCVQREVREETHLSLLPGYINFFGRFPTAHIEQYNAALYRGGGCPRDHAADEEPLIWNNACSALPASSGPISTCFMRPSAST